MKNWGKIVGPEDLVFGTPDVTTNISIGGLFLVSIARLASRPQTGHGLETCFSLSFWFYYSLR